MNLVEAAEHLVSHVAEPEDAGVLWFLMLSEILLLIWIMRSLVDVLRVEVLAEVKDLVCATLLVVCNKLCYDVIASAVVSVRRIDAHAVLALSHDVEHLVGTSYHLEVVPTACS